MANQIRVWMKLIVLAAALRSLFQATILSAQTIVTQPTNQVVLVGSNATFAVTVSGSGYFSYQWRFNGSNIPNNIITTIAGSGPGGQFAWGFSGDSGAATNAEMHYPDGVAVDAQGNVFIGDLWNHRIRKVGTNGIITTVAGNGVQGSAGNGGAATNANINEPMGVALDASGNLFIAEYGNGWVRKLNTNGIITTVTNSSYGSCADVAVDTSGNIFAAYASGLIVTFNSNGVARIVAGGGTNYFGNGIQATNASLSVPAAVAVDTLGNIFIAERQAHRIRKIDTNGIITLIAGNNTNIEGYSGDGGAATNAQLNFPNGLDVAANGNVFIADSYNHRIRVVDTNGIITTVAGGGVGNFSDGPAYLQYPQAVALDPAGNLFIADMLNQRVRKAAFAGFPTLTISSATTNNAGDYSVIITGASGSVTSSVVSLVVTGAPPNVAIQPASLSVAVGASVSLTGNATGTPPLFYQWRFNGTSIAGATDTILLLNNVFPAKGGAYTVTVTNAYGSITSAPVTLTVVSIALSTPRILGNGKFQFSFDTETGVNYTIEYSTTLTQWFPLLTIQGYGGSITVIDPNAFSPQRFYRAELSP
jgi:hypothetical protein